MADFYKRLKTMGRLESACYPLKIIEAAYWYLQSENIRRRFTHILDASGYLIRSSRELTRLQPGDIVFLKPCGWVSSLIRLLIRKRYGIPLKSALSHVQLVIDKDHSLSAEAGGVKLVENRRIKKNTAVTIYRFKEITAAKVLMLQELASEYAGKKYAYGRYLWAATLIGQFFAAGATAVALLLAAITRSQVLTWHGAGFLGVFSLLSLLNIIWKKMDRQGYDCAELVSELLTRTGLWVPFEMPRCEHPNGMKHVMEHLCLWKKARLVAEFTTEK